MIINELVGQLGLDLVVLLRMTAITP